MLLAQHGWQVFLTDLPVLLPLVKLNVEANHSCFGDSESPRVAPLRWGCRADGDNLPARPDLCIGSDITYYDDDFAPLLETLHQLDPAEVLLAVQNRNGCHETFADTARQHGWLVVPASCATVVFGTARTRSYSCARCTVLRLTRRPSGEVPTPAASGAVALAIESLLLRRAVDSASGRTHWSFADGLAVDRAALPEHASFLPNGGTGRADDAPPYATTAYWEARYATRARVHEIYEWYASWSVFCTPVLAALRALSASGSSSSPPAEQLSGSAAEQPAQPRILHVGSGSSDVPEALHAAGFTNQLATDVSATVVGMMAARAAHCDGLKWAVEDALDMSSYSDGSFDAVIDKGTYDALSCARRERRLVREVRRLLRPGGLYVLISSLEWSGRGAFGPPEWSDGQWQVHSTSESENCWVHCANAIGEPEAVMVS